MINVEAVGLQPGTFVSTRLTYKRIKSMTHKELDEYLVGFYKQAFLDGAEACEKALEREQARKEAEDAAEEARQAEQAEADRDEGTDQRDWDWIMSVIRGVKGVGPELADGIEDAVLRAVGGTE